MNINEKTLLFISRFKSLLNSKINTFKIKKNNYIHPIFDPNKFIASQKDTEDVIILAGSFELKSHVEKFNKISKNKTFVLGVNTAAMSGLKIDLAFFEHWQENPGLKTFRSWFEKEYIASGKFSNLCKNTRHIVITNLINRTDSMPMLRTAIKNCYIGLERVFYLPKKRSSDELVSKQINSYLNSKKKINFWANYLPKARATVVKAVLFAVKLKPKRIFIAGLSDGKDQRHFFDNHEQFPDLIEFSKKRKKTNKISDRNGTLNEEFGYWTLPRLINLIAEIKKETEIYVLTEKEALKCPLNPWL